MYKLIVWGCGAVYNAHLSLLRFLEESREAEILGVCGHNLLYGETIDGYPILNLKEIALPEHDYVLVMSDKSKDAIVRDYLDAGGSMEKVIHYSVLDIPNMTLTGYLRIRNARFSILSETCYAGILYNLLQMEVLSPFKNLSLGTQDYFRVLRNLPYYMSIEPTFYKTYDGEPGPYDCPNYPILQLGDGILLYCNHDTDPDEAIAKWNTRREKFNFQNVMTTFYAENRELEEAFYLLPKYARRLCFTPYPSDLPDSVYIPKENGEYAFTEQHRTVKPYNTLLDTYSLFFGPVKYRRI